MDKHTLKIYDEELALLDEKIAQMGGLAEHQFDQSVNALERRDLKLAEEVVTSDRSIDLLQREIVEQSTPLGASRINPIYRDGVFFDGFRCLCGRNLVLVNERR